MTREEMSEVEYMTAFPFVVACIDLATQAWTTCAHPTMRLALLHPRLPNHSNVAFGSWSDYYEWKRLRATSTTTPAHAQPQP